MHALADAYKHALKTDGLDGRIDGLFLRCSLFQFPLNHRKWDDAMMFFDAGTQAAFFPACRSELLENPQSNQELWLFHQKANKKVRPPGGVWWSAKFAVLTIIWLVAGASHVYLYRPVSHTVCQCTLQAYKSILSRPSSRSLRKWGKRKGKFKHIRELEGR